MDKFSYHQQSQHASKSTFNKHKNYTMQACPCLTVGFGTIFIIQMKAVKEVWKHIFPPYCFQNRDLHAHHILLPNNSEFQVVRMGAGTGRNCVLHHMSISHRYFCHFYYP